MDSELKSLEDHGTWEVVKQPEGVKPLTTRFLFTRKYNEEGQVIRYKARLVARGFLQGSVDHTFAPVVDFGTVRTCLAVAVQRELLVHQMDVRTAFLHGDINDEVYIQEPKGISLCNPGEILKLKRGLYGLKQAPRLWHNKWLSVMKKLLFKRCIADECLFRRGNIWLLLYVDDILLIGKNREHLE